MRSVLFEVEEPVEDLTEGGRCGIARSPRRSFHSAPSPRTSSPDRGGSEADWEYGDTRISSSNHPLFRR
jgi:hypothetical protein